MKHYQPFPLSEKTLPDQPTFRLSGFTFFRFPFGWFQISKFPFEWFHFFRLPFAGFNHLSVPVCGVHPKNGFPFAVCILFPFVPFEGFKGKNRAKSHF